MNAPLVCNAFALLLAGFASFARAGTETQACTRPRAGSDAIAPENLFSANGQLNIQVSFRGSVGSDGLARYCYVYEDRVQAPALRVNPGDELVLTLKNDLAPEGSAAEQPKHAMTDGPHGEGACSGSQMTPSSTNLHFHGLHVPPVCHQDEVIHTVIQPGDRGFEYRVKIPKNQPPGLYWYHPHPHGYSERQVLGGASGALIVEGIERAKPEVAGLAERVLVLRDQAVPGKPVDSDEGAAVGKDISLNFVPVVSPLYLPAAMKVRPSEREFWRVLNAAADTYFDIQLVYRLGNPVEHVPQTLHLVALDGAPVDDHAARETNHILLPPGARAEFIVTTPPAGAFAQLVTRDYDTGPDGEKHPYRAIANIISRPDAPAVLPVPAASVVRVAQPSDLRKLRPARPRKLYFSESREGPAGPVTYYITVDGAQPHVFDMNFTRPDVTVRQGTVEDWVIENRSRESHAFHIHQLHFQVLERDGHALNDGTFRDTIELPYWDGRSSTYPSVKLRMDFRSPDIAGTFLYHCHILEHEDGGMMGSIQVLPANRKLRKPNIHSSANTQ